MVSEYIEAKNLSFRYANEPVISDISFTVCPKDFVAVIGSNGTGKSTLIRLLLGELPPSGGSIRLFGQNVSQFKNWPKIGYLPQNPLHSDAGFPATAAEIVQANLYSQIGLLRFPKKEHREKTLRALELVGMSAYSKRLIGELSGGQQQRVMLARVLVSEPELLLLDEPTTGMDTQTVDSLYELLYTLNREKDLTIMMVTHDISRAVNYVSRVFCLEEGSLVELGKPQIDEELSHKHKHPVQDCCSLTKERR